MAFAIILIGQKKEVLDFPTSKEVRKVLLNTKNMRFNTAFAL